mmetsp:Transcript_12204/g.29581  ORF Transcript_12204/g.29581 Transcript_12204/m.29581 type:complete len:234 (-) Transcript_12204:44-745(-)|eukprot:CAMPEP_0181393436 /NCGR_PEP_ID=MMETSP1106-20121128/27187_1 /TAXON_ID=81844 /ORGANISM="Mantoniella antarctica, Strain SL-175" /LENGTH=233 /DNA_ID=CAMNT_0023514753 /DNA_START=150 /DNA_END=851 /DNA_ORIENTATION=+
MTRSVEIAPGVWMPMLGLGTFRAKGENVKVAVRCALSCGYGHIDTASVYKNEEDLATVLAQHREGGGKVFITSKISPFEMGQERATSALDSIRRRLRVDCVDLVLIHWPGAAKIPPDSPQHAILRRATWRVLERELASGRCRAIGVSNYTARHLEELAAYADVLPAVNQVEMHPQCAQAALRVTCARLGVAVVAYSPLGCGALLEHPAVAAAAAGMGCTSAQALLAWTLCRGT